MILHLLAKVFILAFHLVPTSTYAEVSAILVFGPPPALHTSLHRPIHDRLSSYPSNLYNLIFFPLHSQTSFKTHRP